MKAIRHKEVIKKLEQMGLRFIREGKGSHAIYSLNNKTTSIPNHKEISPGVLRNICRDLGLGREFFNDIAA